MHPGAAKGRSGAVAVMPNSVSLISFTLRACARSLAEMNCGGGTFRHDNNGAEQLPNENADYASSLFTS